MNRFIILTAMLLATLSSFAQDDNRENVLIRQDRVWVSKGVQWNTNEHTVRYMKFKDSKDFMDKTYTRVSTIKKVKWTGDDYTDMRIEENIDETEAWMREDDGNVYLLLDGWERCDDSNPSTGISEGLLYDFNAESSYDCISLYKPYEDSPGIFYEGRNRILSVGTETIEDEEKKCYDFTFFRTYPSDDGEIAISCYSMVEGIGIVDDGCLFCVETHSRSSLNNCYRFLCYLDLYGNILYPHNFQNELPGGGLPSAVVDEIDSEFISCPKNEMNTNSPIYDILGRRIAEPASGQIYIQDGKKHIAK